MVGEHACLAATALDLGVFGIGAVFDDELSALLGLDPAREWPLHRVTLGLPVGDD